MESEYICFFFLALPKSIRYTTLKPPVPNLERWKKSKTHNGNAHLIYKIRTNVYAFYKLNEKIKVKWESITAAWRMVVEHLAVSLFSLERYGRMGLKTMANVIFYGFCFRALVSCSSSARASIVSSCETKRHKTATTKIEKVRMNCESSFSCSISDAVRNAEKWTLLAKMTTSIHMSMRHVLSAYIFVSSFSIGLCSVFDI